MGENILIDYELVIVISAQKKEILSILAGSNSLYNNIHSVPLHAQYTKFKFHPLHHDELTLLRFRLLRKLEL